MSLQDWANVAEIVGMMGVVVSLLYVGVQLHQNTAQLQRGEHNSTMEQWSTIRMALATNTELAEIWAAANSGSRAMTAAETLQVESLLAEHLWASFHIWDREQRGVFQPGTFELNAGPLISPLLGNAFGAAWWARAKAAFPPGYAPLVDRVMARESDAQS